MSDRAAVFDDLHAGSADPWSVLTSAYEREKYAATLAALSSPHYGATMEVGCSIGALTVELARRSDRVVAVDVSAVALESARDRCAGLAVAFIHAEVPDAWPEGTFDLIVLSEVLYFLTRTEVDVCSSLAGNALALGGEILSVNWLGETDTLLTGDEAAERFNKASGAVGLVADLIACKPLYRIDRLTRAA